MLQELAKLTMQLARTAAEDALREHAQNIAEPNRPGRRHADPRLVFARLSRDVCRIIALQTRIAARRRAAQPRPRRMPPPAPLAAPSRPEPPPEPKIPAPQLEKALADPRRPGISRYMHAAVRQSQNHQTGRPTHDDLEIHITAALLTDTEHKKSGARVIKSICDTLKLPYDISRMEHDLTLPPKLLAQRPQTHPALATNTP